jgi:hypothetical protein
MPVVYCILLSKRTETYTEMWTTIKEIRQDLAGYLTN